MYVLLCYGGEFQSKWFLFCAKSGTRKYIVYKMYKYRPVLQFRVESSIHDVGHFGLLNDAWMCLRENYKFGLVMFEYPSISTYVSKVHVFSCIMLSRGFIYTLPSPGWYCLAEACLPSLIFCEKLVRFFDFLFICHSNVWSWWLAFSLRCEWKRTVVRQ